MIFYFLRFMISRVVALNELVKLFLLRFQSHGLYFIIIICYVWISIILLNNWCIFKYFYLRLVFVQKIHILVKSVLICIWLHDSRWLLNRRCLIVLRDFIQGHICNYIHALLFFYWVGFILFYYLQLILYLLSLQFGCFKFLNINFNFNRLLFHNYWLF